eukprot:282538-Chlamydomonas_euryale.AAC.3
MQPRSRRKSSPSPLFACVHAFLRLHPARSNRQQLRPLPLPRPHIAAHAPHAHSAAGLGLRALRDASNPPLPPPCPQPMPQAAASQSMAIAAAAATGHQVLSMATCQQAPTPSSGMERIYRAVCKGGGGSPRLVQHHAAREKPQHRRHAQLLESWDHQHRRA